MKKEVINILIADDSGFMRLMIKQLLQEFEGIQVLATASNGKEAFEKTQALKPDVLVLDMLMEEFDGLYAVSNIMQHCPTPIVLLSSLDMKQSDEIIEALRLGAFDFVSKPSGAFNSKIREVSTELVQKIRTAAKVNMAELLRQKPLALKHNQASHSFEAQLPYHIILIGGSTGATSGIEYILNNLPANLPIPVVVIQHMPSSFIPPFVQRLQKKCALPIKITTPQQPLSEACVYVVDAYSNWLLSQNAQGAVFFEPTDEQFRAYNLPSIDSVMGSAAAIFQSKTMGIVLSGMGKDGTLGAQKIFEAQGLTLAQDEESSVVFGMPKSAYEKGFIKHLLPLNDIPLFIVSSL